MATVQKFIAKHPTSGPPLRSWVEIVEGAQWRHLAELRRTFPSADLVGKLMVFNIGGNNYRLVARVDYELQTVSALHVLTHKEYDRQRWRK